MKLVKKSGDNSIYQKRSGRYGVKDASGKWVNGAEKIKVLVAEKLIKTAVPKKEEPVAEAEQVSEAPAEEAPAEEA